METLTLGFVLSSAGVLHRSRREEGGGARGQEKGRNALGTHQSVLTKEVLQYLAPKKGEVVVDATYGQGGHSKVLKRPGVKLISLDADPAVSTDTVITANFADLESVLKKLEIKKINKVIFDLGWNREQLASGRGFSFMHDEPLNMSYGENPRSGFNAAEVLNVWSEKALADLLYGYGEERYARRIARKIVERRAFKPFETTIELLETIADSVPASYRHGRLHFATKSFQALRIAVNSELQVLEQGITAAWKHLACKGRIAVISFHSIEDRAVKRLFVGWAKKNEGMLVVKKPIIASREEMKQNPSARSAKLRVIEKLCTD